MDSRWHFLSASLTFPFFVGDESLAVIAKVRCIL